MGESEKDVRESKGRPNSPFCLVIIGQSLEELPTIICWTVFLDIPMLGDFLGDL